MIDKANSPYTREIVKYGLLTADEEKELAGRIGKGDVEALNRLVTSNLRLVVKLANRYRGLGVDFNDLVGAGNVGLIEAAKRYDAAKGTKFDSYAQYWIRHEMRAVLSRMSGAVSVSNTKHMNDRTIMNARNELGENATVDDISRKSGFSPRHVRNVLCRRRSKVYLLEKVNGGDGADGKTYLDILDEGTDDTPYSLVEKQEMVDVLRNALKTLDSRDRYIIESWYGLNDCKRKSLAEMGDEFGFSREYIRLLRDDAETRLKKAVLARM